MKISHLSSLNRSLQQSATTMWERDLLYTLYENRISEGCSCIRFTSTYGKERGTFSSPDYPRPYPAHINCLLYTFIAGPHQIVELVFTDFDIYKEHLE
ncbi:hypothetical protein RR46_08224 [Papilio xuthus]|uniref:CUB domain-containing protein n=1 Tax=Papilio xuthus TaxID=66420 RepID=A0A194QAC4_PAPXU|nr:hypothetical protein RR46_08224 [Papilio xuthus]